MQYRLSRFDYLSGLAAVILFALIAILPFHPNKFGDGDFHREAKALAMAVRGQGPLSDVGITHAPFPVIYYSIPYLVAIPNDNNCWLAGFLWNCFWMLVSLLLLRQAVGPLAVIFTLLVPFWGYYVYGVSAEPPAYLGAVLMIYGSALINKKILFLGLCVFTLSRPEGLLLIPVLLLIGLWKRQRLALECAAVCVAVTLLISFAIGFLPGRAEARKQEGTLAHVALQGRFQYRDETWDWREWGSGQRSDSRDYQAWKATREELKHLPGEESLAKRQLRWVASDIINHPLKTAKMIVVRTISSHLAFVNSVSVDKFRIGPVPGLVVYWVLHVLLNVVSLTILGLAIAFMVKDGFWNYWPYWGPWGTLLIFHAILYAEPRYLFAGRAGLIALAALFLSRHTPKILKPLRHFRGPSLVSRIA